ncbi:MAG: hypothetical protein QOD81_827 [Solirubrobacteraceae bacterium]|jgi:uncharacterized protein (TIGR02271 family)|nr:hypothetical protein [Solirubrobacteraceae bacterium]
MPTTQEIADWKGQKVVGNDDEKLGTVEDIYLDEDTGRPEWLAVKTGLFGTKVSFVPLADAERHDDHIHVPYDKDLVKDSPNAEADGALSQEEEARLYRHYGHDYSETRSDSGLPAAGGDRTTGREPVGEDVSGPETDDAMTRSEEELDVGTRRREAGRVRLRKYVVTENVTRTVPVQREEVRVEREPITDANRDAALAGGELTEEEHEVRLHAEEPVVEKRVVPKERVRLDKDTVTEEQQVSDEVRKERIESEGDVAPGDAR